VILRVDVILVVKKGQKDGIFGSAGRFLSKISCLLTSRLAVKNPGPESHLKISGRKSYSAVA
jgi:hypothetical protein